MISNRLKIIFEQKIAHCKNNSANIFTHEEYAKMLNVSRRKFSDFINKRNYDFGLLEGFLAIHGYVLDIDMHEQELTEHFNFEIKESKESDELKF